MVSRKSSSIEALPNGFVHKTVALGAVTLAYVEGPANGPPLLFIPGQSESWEGYGAVLPDFAADHHVFVVEPRGHGGSTKTPGDYSFVRIGEDLARFLREVVGAPAIVSGLSSGAVVALWLAANAPDHVRAVCAEDPPLYVTGWPRISRERYMTRLFDEMASHFEQGKRDFLGYFQSLAIPKPGSDELLVVPEIYGRLVAGLFRLNAWLRPARRFDVPFLSRPTRLTLKFLTTFDTDMARATIDGRLADGFDPDATLAAIRCPALLLHAQVSVHETWGQIGALSVDDLARATAALPTLQVVEIDARHEIHIAAPEAFATALRRFLDGLK